MVEKQLEGVKKDLAEVKRCTRHLARGSEVYERVEAEHISKIEEISSEELRVIAIAKEECLKSREEADSLLERRLRDAVNESKASKRDAELEFEYEVSKAIAAARLAIHDAERDRDHRLFSSPPSDLSSPSPLILPKF